MAKDKKKNDKDEKKPKIQQPAPVTVAGGGTYADGAPLDNITYLEAKLILKPDRFTSVESFREFGRLVQKVAKKSGVGFIPDAEAGLRPQIRDPFWRHA